MAEPYHCDKTIYDEFVCNTKIKYHTLTEHECEVTASAVAFRPALNAQLEARRAAPTSASEINHFRFPSFRLTRRGEDGTKDSLASHEGEPSLPTTESPFREILTQYLYEPRKELCWI
ncbi:hypothetical protein EVAR_40069_1 [Eumeta japonica]|uniref:Uncharacterized protein n=1 Tax=Eumeta variegata TaxID=151549 RepID=A0A4C1X1I5_EUMVA|nr:hypothetical protein EVAR_40069_1 [Eumeta japonica]